MVEVRMVWQLSSNRGFSFASVSFVDTDILKRCVHHLPLRMCEEGWKIQLKKDPNPKKTEGDWWNWHRQADRSTGTSMTQQATNRRTSCSETAISTDSAFYINLCASKLAVRVNAMRLVDQEVKGGAINCSTQAYNNTCSNNTNYENTNARNETLWTCEQTHWYQQTSEIYFNISLTS